MGLCNITGLLKDSGDQLLTGELWVQLDAPLVDIDTTPDSTVLPRLAKFEVTAGDLETAKPIINGVPGNVTGVHLRQSEVAGATYRFQFWAQASVGPPVVLDEDPAIDFHAFVPNVAEVDFADLIPTGITTDSLDTAIARLARLLTTNQQFAAALRGGPRYLGNYNPDTYYQLDDCVAYAGSSWIWISPTPAVGSTPSASNPNWQQAGAKGEPGGIGGQDTPYDSTGWDGATWAPTANAVRDVIVTLATVAQVNARTTPAGVETQITNRFNDTALTGNPTAPTQDPNVALATNGSRVANMSAVKGAINRYSRIIDSKAAGANGGSSIAAGIVTRDLNTTTTNAGDVVSLASNTFTLRPGTYRIWVSAPGLQCGLHKAFLWSVTGAVRILNGTAESSGSTLAGTPPSRSIIGGQFAIATNTDFQIRQYTQTATATFGLGAAVNENSQPEIYTVVELWRVD